MEKHSARLPKALKIWPMMPFFGCLDSCSPSSSCKTDCSKSTARKNANPMAVFMYLSPCMWRCSLGLQSISLFAFLIGAKATYAYFIVIFKADDVN